MTRSMLITALSAAFLATAANGQEVRQYRANDAVDPRDVARILGNEPAKPKMLMRSIRLTDETTRARQPERAQDATAPEVQRPRDQYASTYGVTLTDASPARVSALALPVKFGFDSATIMAEARPQLDAIAEGIKLLPAGRSVVIEGHTDAAGPDQYNLYLSMRRAAAVKEYLVATHGIDATRLQTRGFGEDQPINKENPNAAENRRVQFRGS